VTLQRVFDFLYHDARRVGSFLAQLDEAGLLTSVTRKEGKTTSNRGAAEAKLEGSLPFLGKAGGGSSVSREAAKSGHLERTFDPLWQNARRFVDYAQENCCPVSDATIGQIVSLTGEITIIDFEFLKKFMANKSIMESLLDQDTQDGNRKERRSNQKSQGSVKSKEPPIAELFGLFPYKVQMTVDGEKLAWATISEDFLVTEASDLVLKYGGALDGKWTVLGILDAIPSIFNGDIVGNMNFEGGIEAFGMKLTKAFAPMARVLLGRPSDAYGITPLVVYREID
jgi:hypothetical protein